jgi:hypothetical protein
MVIVQVTVRRAHSFCSCWWRAWLVWPQCSPELTTCVCGEPRAWPPLLPPRWSHGCWRFWLWALPARRFTPDTAATRGWYGWVALPPSTYNTNPTLHKPFIYLHTVRSCRLDCPMGYGSIHLQDPVSSVLTFYREVCFPQDVLQNNIPPLTHTLARNCTFV